MMRKLVKQGQNALTVTVPASWIKKKGLKQGSEVVVEEQGDILMITSPKGSGIKTYNIKINKHLQTNKTYLKRFLSAIYKRDYDEIIMSFDDSQSIAIIQECVQELMGFEIISQNNNVVHARNISHELETEFDNLLKTCINHVYKGAELTLDLFDGKPKETEILSMERLNNKFTDLLKRTLNRSGFYDKHKTLFYYSIVRDVEKMVDKYRDNCKYLEGKKIKISKETKNFYMHLQKITEIFQQLNFAFTYERVNELRKEKHLIRKRYQEIIASVSKEEIFLILNGYIILDEIFELIGSIFAIHLPPSIIS